MTKRTTATATPTPPKPSKTGPRLLIAIEIVLIFAVFIMQGGILAPGSNEPNYLAKAHHYWNPDWCGDDFFLNSADAHLVFYWTYGWLATWLSLPAMAVVGRVLTYLLLAAGWQRLSWAMVPRSLYSVLGAALFVLMNERFHMAGEWLVGGVEAKGFAYGLVMFGLASLVKGRWRSCWIWFGAAASLHVLVGGWTVIAAFLAWAVCGRRRESFLEIFPFMFVGLVLASPGLWAALTTTTVAEPAIVDRAARIQVFHRLDHHLNPLKFWYAGRFSNSFVGEFGLRFSVLTAVFVALYVRLRSRARVRRLGWFVFGSLLIALLGAVVAIAFRDDQSSAAMVLRYYLYRLSDVVVPLGVALLTCAALVVERRQHRVLAQSMLVVLMLLACWHLGEKAYLRQYQVIPAAERKLSKTEQQYADWIDICRFIDESTEPHVVFLTPMHATTFKWHANRSEVVNWKEMPQDATSIDEWWKRVRRVHRDEEKKRWRRSFTELSPQQLQALGGQYQAHYLVTEAKPPLALPLISRNDSFAVYQLGETLVPTDAVGKDSAAATNAAD